MNCSRAGGGGGGGARKSSSNIEELKMGIKNLLSKLKSEKDMMD